LKALGKGLVLPFYLAYKLEKKAGLGLIVFFVFFILPSMAGTFYFLLSQDLHPVVAVPATVGMTLGGAPMEIWNVVQSIPNAYPVEILFMIVGLFDSIHRLVFFGLMWFKINRFVGGKNISGFWILLLGLLVFLLSLIIALVVDVYALKGVRRLPGLTYTLTSFETVMEPFFDLVRDEYISNAGNTSGLNTEVNNSSTAG